MTTNTRDTTINPDRDAIFVALDIGHMDDHARLSWMLAFAQRSDLDRLRGADLLRAQAETLAFSPAADAVATTKRLTAKRLATLSAEIREGVERFVDGRGWRAQLQGRIKRLVYRDRATGQVRETLETSLPALVLWTAQNLVRENADGIARCAHAACGRWFAVVKRQQFCSGACASKFRTAKWRANPKNREKTRERRRHAYKNAQAERQGRPITAIKIQRRRTK